MIHVYKSDTGQFVLLHYPSQTVIIDERLEPAFEKMQAYVKENHPELAKEINRPFDQKVEKAPTPARDFAAKAALWALVLLPFLWLVTLHTTISGAVGDVMTRFEKSVQTGGKHDEVTKRLNEMQTTLSALGRDVSSIKSGEKPAAETEGAPDLAAIQKSVETLTQTVTQLQTDLETVKKAAPAQP